MNTGHSLTHHPTSRAPSLLTEAQVSALAVQFARFCAELDPDATELALLTAAALAERSGRGDTCLDLRHLASRALLTDEDGQVIVDAPPLDEWRSALNARFIGEPGEYRPLILEGPRIYLHRQWREERDIASALSSRFDVVPLDVKGLRRRLDDLFGVLTPTDGGYWQRLAAAMALTRRVSVITGGPGTGKTTAVTRILALLLEADPDQEIRLAAPTGKAAARLAESINRQIEGLGDRVSPHVLERIPRAASTVHRLLGWAPRGFAHNAENRLRCDCLILDECSMVDQRLMASLLTALPDHARVILLGDRDQLASVEAGSVLGDITGRGAELKLSPQRGAELATLMGGPVPEVAVGTGAPPIADHIALLRHSFRFETGGGIGRLAAAVNSGDPAAVADVIDRPDPELSWLPAEGPRPPGEILQWSLDRYLRIFEARSPEEALSRFESARVLTALRRGPWGETALRNELHEALGRRGLTQGADEWSAYHGLPILILRNDYETGLFNGDAGIVWQTDDRLQAWFRREGELLAFTLPQLPAWQPAWTITVHRSQGSEYDEVLLVLPPVESRVVTRELIYTGVTRARRHCTVVADREQLAADVQRTVERYSGLAERLGWGQEL